MLNSVKSFLESGMRLLYRLTIKRKVKKIRSKETICVLFVLNDISKWKSESLYLRMREHPRFKPIIGVTYRRGESVSSFSRKVVKVIGYLESRQYDYIELNYPLKPSPDIVIYTEPYPTAVPKEQSLFKYFNSLFISINYSCHTTHLSIDYFTRLHECAWIDCYESKLAIESAYQYIGRVRKNIKYTGLPMIDQLLEPAQCNPWKQQNRNKKRIIWAPHHSIGGFKNETIIYSNFLEISDYMRTVASEFRDEIQIAFKPHPLLREKLNVIWGTDRTDEYYNFWDEMENCQLSEGDYSDLFKNSDALIHDSSSFIVEYQVVNKPILFMVKDKEDIVKDLNKFGETAFFSQVLGTNKSDIRDFIRDVINKNDFGAERRNKFVSQELLPPNGQSACDNIIDEILGEKSYKEL